mmetsp:Transcript_20251/g.21997  ORF Transcript_20251/g.21997 Transcript_20251/m.21997 type:complete len:160 (+) Transcript_20251:1946-2425(+)
MKKGRNLFNDFSYILNTRHLTFHNIDYIQTVIDMEGSYRDALRNLTSLYICDCNQLRNVRGLGGIYNLSIKKWHGLEDITNHTVHLVDCPKVTDVSILKTIPVVKLIRCPQVRNLNEFKRCGTSIICAVKNIMEFSNTSSSVLVYTLQRSLKTYFLHLF